MGKKKQQEKKEEELTACPNCDEEIPLESTECPECGHNLAEEDEVEEIGAVHAAGEIKKTGLVIGLILSLAGVVGIIGLRMGIIQTFLGDASAYPGIGSAENIRQRNLWDILCQAARHRLIQRSRVGKPLQATAGVRDHALVFLDKRHFGPHVIQKEQAEVLLKHGFDVFREA